MADVVDATGIHAAIQGAKKGKKAQPAKFFCKKTPLSPSFAISRRIFDWFLFLFCFLQ